MRYLFVPIFITSILVIGASAQGDTAYLASAPINAAGGSFAFELMNAEVSQLAPAQSLWVYGDGNFEIKSHHVLESTHQFRIEPVEAVTFYRVGIYDDGAVNPGITKPFHTSNINSPLTPSGGAVVHSGWIEKGHYAALKLFPEVLNHQSIPVAMMAIQNHQKVPVSGNAYLYYKSNLTRDGLNDIPVSYSVLKEHFNYGNVSTSNSLNAPAKPGYQILRSWSFTDLQPDEERHLFVSLQETPAWQNIADINTADYATEFMLLVTGNGSFAFEKEIVISPPLEAYHDPAFLDVYFDAGKEQEEVAFDLFFYNEGSMPVRNIRVAFEFPAGLVERDFQIVEKTIGPVGFSVAPAFNDDTSILNFEAKNVGLGKYDPSNPNTYGKIKVKVKMPYSRWKEVKANIKFDNSPDESAHWRNVPDAQH